ncbi:PEP-CTERM sorting domain-containing protein [Candidatus Endoriftia persephone]|uniref:PEP-CTERM sorting domain-containing protein n=1 Tax=Candidatus Endoriftia persephonae TaxID=393765 RepID=A0A9J6ZVR6_9GAMM|nr:PEP-CTERM sorting domain-containing protein [Candidatus Endoriftia persephone]USF86950.1 PEP-CTERM sorting domain-containing protein [Candidatus Endoriftia persephone]
MAHRYFNHEKNQAWGSKKMRKITKITKLTLAFCSLAMAAFSVQAAVIPLDLNDFYADPTVSVAVDGGSALMEENPAFSITLLSNDPLMGDPGIDVPTGLLSLDFDFSFSEPAGNDDEFYAFVFNGDTGALIDDFSVNWTDAGSVSWDLSGLDASVTLLGMEFQLVSNLPSDGGLESTVAVSNVHLVTENASVPEPGSLTLLGIGLVGGLFGFRKKSS